MSRETRRSAQLPTPPQSLDDSLSAESMAEFVNTEKERRVARPAIVSRDNGVNSQKSRVLRRHSLHNTARELHTFFAMSPLPIKGNKVDSLLLRAIDSVSSFWEGPSRANETRDKSEGDSALSSANPESNGAPSRKRYLTSGLYAGSRTSTDCAYVLGRSRKSDPVPRTAGKFKFLLPIFEGRMLIEQQRDFKLPWNLYATTGKNCKPPNWSRIRRNIYVDVDPCDKKADRPECLCRSECDEVCLNRAMFYECDDQNCALDNPSDCSNRTFQEAAFRYAERSPRSCGFEVFDTGDRGFGLRALRDFQPDSFILEYRGEVISTEECEHRMITMYAGRNNHYFLNIDANTVLDAGRKGSEARFANHSCDPNARIEKWIVKGEPRIGVFAGKRGIEAGEEITYDYNFSWFEGAKEQKCMCAANNCRGFIGKKRAALPKPNIKTPNMKKAASSKGIVKKTREVSNSDEKKSGKKMRYIVTKDGKHSQGKRRPTNQKDKPADQREKVIPSKVHDDKRAITKGVLSKVKRVINGRVAKVMDRTVKSKIKNGSAITPMVVITKPKPRATDPSKRQPRERATNSEQNSGKRKRSDISEPPLERTRASRKVGTSQSVVKPSTSGRASNPMIYDTVRNPLRTKRTC